MEKIKQLDELVDIAKQLKAAGKKIVTTNGCFDILHRGHIELLKKAKELGDVLIVGINSDVSVKRLKGPGRPINNELDRAAVIAAIGYVDYVFIFDELTPCAWLEKLKPAVHVKGKDYENVRMPERSVVEGYSGKVILIDIIDGISTSTIINKIKK